MTLKCFYILFIRLGSLHFLTSAHICKVISHIEHVNDRHGLEKPINRLKEKQAMWATTTYKYGELVGHSQAIYRVSVTHNKY